MSITINGNGTVTGISVGGLPDGIVDTDMLATNAVTSAKTSLNTITHYDTWRLSADINDSNAQPMTNVQLSIDANGRNGFGTIGAAMTESSGVFTFPVTGLWKVELYVMWSSTDNTISVNSKIDFTTNGGSSFEALAQSIDSCHNAGSDRIYAATSCSALLDITDVSQRKVQFDASYESYDSSYNDMMIHGGDRNKTHFNFIRLGDT